MAVRIFAVLTLSAVAVVHAQPRVQARLAPAGAAAADPIPVLSLPVMGLISGGLISGAGPAEVRPLVGLPGSAIAGDALRMPEGTRRVHLDPGQELALVERTGAAIGVLAFDGGLAGELSEIAGAMARADLVAFSPSGGHAVLYAAQ